MKKLSITILIVIVLIAGSYFIFFNKPRVEFESDLATISVEGAGEYGIKQVSEEKNKLAQNISKFSESLGQTVDISMSDGQTGALEETIAISFQYKKDSEAHKKLEANSDSAYIARFDEEKNIWLRLPSTYDKGSRTLSAKTDHLSIYDGRIAMAELRAKLNEVIALVEAEAPAGLANVAGHMLVADGEVIITSDEGTYTAASVAGEIHDTWGCHENPASGVLNVSRTTDIIDEVKGASKTLLVDVVAEWKLDSVPATILSGTVIDQEGEPVEGGNLKAKNVHSGEIFPGTTDEAGKFEIDFKSGTYVLSFEKSDCESKTRPAEELCGWSSIFGSSSRQAEFAGRNFETECEESGTGGFHGTVNYTYMGGISLANKVDLDLVKETEENKKKSSIFWAGKWVGTMTQNMDLGESAIMAQVPGLVNLDIQENAIESKVELYLVADKKGKVDSTSYAIYEQLNEASGSSGFTVDTGQGAISGDDSWSAGGTGGGKVEIEILSQSKEKLEIKIKGVPPFDQPSIGADLMTINNPAVIVLEKEESN